jgi:hypothetical protein
LRVVVVQEGREVLAVAGELAARVGKGITLIFLDIARVITMLIMYLVVVVARLLNVWDIVDITLRLHTGTIPTYTPMAAMWGVLEALLTVVHI